MRGRLFLLAVVLCVLVFELAGASHAVTAVAPSNTSAPGISGQAEQGSVLTASSGAWAGTTPMSFVYQWLRCDSAGANCVDIGGATGQTYSLALADVGETIRVRVTASNSDGSASATSDQTAVVSGANAPSNTSPPTISGTVRQGETLTAGSGSWSGTQPISYAYQWQRCNPAGLNCGDVGGATASTYVLQKNDVGKTMRVAVTASNAAGSGQALSGPSSVVAEAGAAPAVTAAPKISGNPVAGQTLTLSSGSWSGTAPIAFAYQWQRCDASGGNCASIPGATGTTYVVQVGDTGHRLRGAVTASNIAGSTTAVSARTAKVQGLPQPVKPPSIAGAARVGERLTLSTGSWRTPTPLTRITQQWFRCSAAGQNCVAIPGATARAYTITEADLGRRLHVLVKAENAFGAGFANSQATAVVAPRPTGPVSVASLALPNRLTIAKVKFTPARIRSRSQPLIARFRVVEAHGRPVVGALVLAIAIPYNRLSAEPEAATGNNGWATITFKVRPTFPLKRGYLVTIFARARKPGGSILGGISTRRLVSVRVG